MWRQSVHGHTHFRTEANAVSMVIPSLLLLVVAVGVSGCMTLAGLGVLAIRLFSLPGVE